MINHKTIDLCAEFAWIRYGHGKRLPLEISIAKTFDPDQVYILQMILPNNFMVSMTDLIRNKGYSRCKDRFHHQCINVANEVKPIIYKMHVWNWRSVLNHVLKDVLFANKQNVGVRSKRQKKFFKKVCRLPNVTRIKGKPKPERIFTCNHQHNKLYDFPCTSTEARTMAVEQFWDQEIMKLKNYYKQKRFVFAPSYDY